MQQKITILITRPIQEARVLSQLLEQHGFATLVYPTIEIQPTLSTDQLKEKFKLLPKYQIVIFNSVNAVRIAGPTFRTAYLKCAHPPQIYAIGRATAHALVELGFAKISYPSTEFSSDALIQLLRTPPSHIEDGLLISGEGGLSSVLAKNLSPLGIAVTVLPCYKRACPAVTHPKLWMEWANQGVTHIVITSQDALRHLWLMQRSAEALDFVRQCHFVVFSARIAQYAETLQLHKSKISITTEASNHGILEFFKNNF